MADEYTPSFGDIPVGADQSLMDMLKKFLGIDLSNIDNDEKLSFALNLSGDVVEHHLDRVVVQREIEEIFEAQFDTQMLKERPTDIVVNPPKVYVDDVEDTSYKVYLDNAYQAHLTRTDLQQDIPLAWRKFAKVRVVYTAGFNPIPSPLAQAIVYTAADIYTSQGTGVMPQDTSSDVKSVSLYDVGSVTYNVNSAYSVSVGVIPAVAVQLLSKYKRIAA